MPTPNDLIDPQAAPVAPPDQLPEAPPVADPPAPVVEDTVPYRVGEQEVPLPLSALEALAGPLGFENAAAVLNQLRNGAEAQDIMRQARTIFQQVRQRSQPPQYGGQGYASPPPVDQRWQQHLQRETHQPPPQAQPPNGGEPDPWQLLTDIRAQVGTMTAYIQQQQDREFRELQARSAKLEHEANRDYDKFVSALQKQGVPEWKIPNRDYLLGEAEMMGMFHGDMNPAQMYEAVWKMSNADFMAQNAAQNAVQSHVERMRDPKARVTVPVSRPAPPPAASNPIDSMKLSDLLPEIGSRI